MDQNDANYITCQATNGFETILNFSDGTGNTVNATSKSEAIYQAGLKIYEAWQAGKSIKFDFDVETTTDADGNTTTKLVSITFAARKPA